MNQGFLCKYIISHGDRENNKTRKTEKDTRLLQDVRPSFLCRDRVSSFFLFSFSFSQRLREGEEGGETFVFLLAT